MRNESGFVVACLRSALAGLDHAGVCAELLVIDGDSADDTVALVGEIAARDPRVRLIQNPARTAPAGLNLGLQQARGTVIVRLDGHAIFPEHYFSECLTALLATGATNTGGVVVTRSRGSGPMARALAATTSLPVGVGRGFRTGTPSGWVDTVPYGCFRRDVFERIGFFDERLTRGQDYEFNRRMVRRGGKIWRDASIQVEYFQVEHLGTFLSKQLWAQGPGVAAMWCIAPWSLTARHLAPLLLVLGSVVLGVLAMSHSVAAVLLLVCAVGYEGAIALSARRLVPQIGVAAAALIPLTVPLYHLTYGTGILFGLLAMPLRLLQWSRWRRPWRGASSFSAMTAVPR